VSSKTILYATDYSDATWDALRIATSLAQDLHAKLLIVHVSRTEIGFHLVVRGTSTRRRSHAAISRML
jgi:nucleotide-binding universal stress UspA family protein